MPGVNASNGGSGVIGTVIIYHGKLHENAKKRLAACRKDDEPVLAINMDLFKKNRRTVNRDIITWSTNHQIDRISFCTQKGELSKKPYGKFYCIKAAARDCKRSLKMAQEFPNMV
jgi:hypothetical protein